MICGTWDGLDMGIHSRESLESHVGQGMMGVQWARCGGGQRVSVVTCGAVLTTISFYLHPHLRGWSPALCTSGQQMPRGGARAAGVGAGSVCGGLWTGLGLGSEDGSGSEVSAQVTGDLEDLLPHG